MPEQERQDLLDGIAVSEKTLERRHGGPRVLPNDRLRELEHVGFDRPAHERPDVRGHDGRVAGIGAELLDLLLDALGVAAGRGRERGDRLGIELDPMKARARRDPSGDVDRRKSFDALDRSASGLDSLQQVRRRDVRRLRPWPAA